MLFKIVLPIALLLVCSVSAKSNVNLDAIIAQQNQTIHLLKRIYTSRSTGSSSSSSGPPSSSQDGLSGSAPRAGNADYCFDTYVVDSNKINDKYRRDFKACSISEQNQKLELTIQSSDDRKKLIRRGNSICADLYGCEVYQDGYAFMSCYHQASDNNYQNLYGISVESEEKATYLRIQYRRIDDELDICTTRVHNIYVEDMAVCNMNLENCLYGKPSIPTTTIYPPTTRNA